MQVWRDWAANSAIALALMASPLARLAVLAPAVAAAAESGGTKVATYAPLGGPASVPHGWLDFCRRYAGECGGGPLAPLDISLTARAM